MDLLGDVHMNSYSVKSYIIENLKKSRYTCPTPIQMQSIPVLIEGRDLLACAPTGSGKTISYVLPILHRLKIPSKRGCRALIIVPTRELAEQVYREIKKLADGRKFMIQRLTKLLSPSQEDHGVPLLRCDVLITTPLRLVHELQEDRIRLDRVESLVLDEADKLLELGFLEQIDGILAACTLGSLQKILFSATLPQKVEELAKTFMNNPVRITIGLKNAASDTIRQRLIFVGQEEAKLYTIRQLVMEGLRPPILVFVQSIDRAKELFHELVYEGIRVDLIHSDRTQAQREMVIKNFRLGTIWVLIATDLMARGMDFKGINCVINYDFPQSITSYIHRIGRTGRAGRPGEAITLFTTEDAVNLRR
jgi:ATP-dependent RNA helicase DDX52/ROK1